MTAGAIASEGNGDMNDQDASELLDFAAMIAGLSAGPVQAQANALLVKHGRPAEPPASPELVAPASAAPASQGSYLSLGGEIALFADQMVQRGVPVEMVLRALAVMSEALHRLHYGAAEAPTVIGAASVAVRAAAYMVERGVPPVVAAEGLITAGIDMLCRLNPSVPADKLKEAINSLVRQQGIELAQAFWRIPGAEAKQ